MSHGLTQAITAVASEVSPILRDAFNKRDFALTRKADRSPVTNVDLDVQELIVKRLAAIAPGIPVLGEEQPDDSEVAGEVFFAVDPIDGTSNFSIGLPFFAVSIALVDQGQSRIGVVASPMTGDVYVAERGAGAWKNGIPLRAREYRPLDRCHVGINVAKLAPVTRIAIGELIGVRVEKLRCLGSISLELSLVASGVLDGVVNHFLATWDISAAGLILTEAGGIWTDHDGGIPSPKSRKKFPICAAGNERLHSELMAIIRDAVDSPP